MACVCTPQVALLITSAFQAAFQRWTVGLGIEHQLNELLAALDITGTRVRATTQRPRRGWSERCCLDASRPLVPPGG